jgi:exonuclease 3'-5' domain-containing protein 1
MSTNTNIPSPQTIMSIDGVETGGLVVQFLPYDIEGLNLSRSGSIAILQILFPPKKRVYLVDVHILKALAFETPSNKGLTLKSILESEQIPKVFFDVPN